MASTKLTRTPSSAGNRKTFTFSVWVKRSGFGNNTIIDCNFGGGSNEHRLKFEQDYLWYYDYSGGYTFDYKTNRYFRDSNGFYHIVCAVDMTQGTASDRVKIYVNGVQETSFATATHPSNVDTQWNTTNLFQIGTQNTGVNYFDGVMSHFHFIDGTAYDASYFGETDATTGEWKIKTSPSVTYGTNGFWILKDGNSVTDQSGNGNNFTVASGTLTNTEDNPSNVFATGNPLAQLSVGTLSNGNNTITGSNTTNYYGFISSTLGISSGKYYAEFKKISGNVNVDVGISDNPNCDGTNTSDYLGVGAYQWSYDANTGNVRNNSSSSAYGDSYTDGDIIGVALDLDNNKLYFAKNGTWQNSGDPTSGATGTGAISITAPTSNNTGVYHFAFGDNSGSSYSVVSANFGNGYFGTTAVASAGTNASGLGIFEYDVPSGYTALCTKGLNL